MVVGSFAKTKSNRVSGFNDLRRTARLISRSDDLHSTCLLVEDYLAHHDMSLMGVTFCDLEGGLPSIRAFRRHSEAVLKLATVLKDKGGCPVINEAKRLHHCFDALQIDRSRYPEFLNKRFLDELAKSGHKHILVIPILLGQGLAIFSIGTREQRLTDDLRVFLINAICQSTVAIIDRFPDVTKLFAPKRLSTFEAEALMFCSNGYSNSDIADLLKISETTINIVFDNASKKLGTHNQAHAVSKALAVGEISNLQIGEFELL